MTNSADIAPGNLRSLAWLWRLTTLGWAALIFILSGQVSSGLFSAWLVSNVLSILHLSVSPVTFALLHGFVRKAAHFTEYAIFSVLLYGCFRDDLRFKWRGRTAFWCVIIAGVYALADEFHQSFVPGRGPSLIDCGIDVAGAALGMLALYGSGRFRRAKSSKT